jgi:hypothetical protein
MVYDEERRRKRYISIITHRQPSEGSEVELIPTVLPTKLLLYGEPLPS